MNTRIMVRGKGANTGNWYYGTYFCHRPYMPSPMGEDREKWENETKHYIIFQQSSDWGLPYTDVQVVVDPATLGQCTGHHIKGKWLFEGDIIKMNFVDGLHTVVWCPERSSWMLLCNEDFVNLLPTYLEGAEIVGNIYDGLERKD